MKSSDQYDYIVVGSGASGSVLANRLSKNPANQVLLIEAGGTDKNADIQNPAGFVKLWNTDLDWKIQTEKQSGLSDRSILINQGKVLGGSTAINAMMYVRGNPDNFNEWERLGAAGWSYQDVLPYFKELENFEGDSSEWHGENGDLSIRVCPDQVMRSPHFLNGAVELGYDGPEWDYNGKRQENGAALLQFHIAKNGQRDSASSAFLDPVKNRPNLTILTGAFVTQVLIDKDKAIGVEYSEGGVVTKAFSAKEVILSAGALATPKLLLLSGIGPAEDLKALNMKQVKDLPGVGKNLQDHLQLPMVYRSKIPLPNTTLLTGNTLFVNTNGEGVVDLQLNFTPSLPGPLAPVLPDFGGPICIFLPILVQPASRGEVKLRTNDPWESAIVDPQYLSERSDVEVLKSAVALVRNLASTKAFEPLSGEEIVPGLQADIEAFIRGNCSTLWHPAGTCKMGVDEMSVVDENLKVYGIKGLRVADASIMPTVISGNTVAACFMIGAKAADMILTEHDD